MKTYPSFLENSTVQSSKFKLNEDKYSGNVKIVLNQVGLDSDNIGYYGLHAESENGLQSVSDTAKFALRFEGKFYDHYFVFNIAKSLLFC